MGIAHHGQCGTFETEKADRLIELNCVFACVCGFSGFRDRERCIELCLCPGL